MNLLELIKQERKILKEVQQAMTEGGIVTKFMELDHKTKSFTFLLSNRYEYQRLKRVLESIKSNRYYITLGSFNETLYIYGRLHYKDMSVQPAQDPKKEIQTKFKELKP